MNKSTLLLIIGMVLLLLALPSLYWGLCLAVYCKNLISQPLLVAPVPCMILIIASFVTFHKAENAL